MVMCLSVCLLRRMDGMVKLAWQDGTPELCNRFCKRFALIRGRLATKTTIPWEELEAKAWTVHVASFCTW